MTRDDFLSVNDLSKTFENGTTAFSKLSFSVEKGDFLSLIGPSGCGKSTILQLIAGLTRPTSGTIEWNSENSSTRPDLAFVFQDATLMPWATVFDNVWLPLRLKGVSKNQAEREIENALELVGLLDAKNAFPRELSGGMKMRVSIARTLITKPQILLMDEPFAALDDITRQKLNDDILRLKAEFGWTIVFVTHSIYEAVYLSNRVAVMGRNSTGELKETRIGEPYPRNPSFRTSNHYTKYVEMIAKTLEHVSLEKAEQ